MEYNWTKENFIKDAEELKKLIDAESDFNKTLFLRKVYDAINYHIYNNYTSNPNISISRKDYRKSLLYEVCRNHYAFARYFTLVERFYLKLRFLNEDNYDDVDKHLERWTSTYITHEDNMSLVSEFYMSIPDNDIRNAFKSIYDKRYETYKFVNENEWVDINDAYTIFISGLNKNYVSICDVNGAKKFINTVHETGHAMTNLMNPQLLLKSDNDFFKEVQALFFEILALKKFRSDKFNTKELIILLFSDLISLFDDSFNFTVQRTIANVAKLNDYKINQKLFSMLKKDYSIDKRFFDKAIKVEFEQEATYILSFAVALKLVNIYLDNKKEGIELLKRTIMNPLTQDDLEYTLGIIDPFEGLEEAGKKITLDYKRAIKG